MERRKSLAGKVFLKKREKGKKHWKIAKLFVSDSGRERIMLFLIPKSGNPVPKPSFRRPPSFPPQFSFSCKKIFEFFPAGLEVDAL